MKNTFNLKENIAFILSYRNLKQGEFGNMIGVRNSTTINNWLSGVANPPIHKLFEISKVFNIPLDTLVYGDKKDVEAELSDFQIESRPHELKEDARKYISRSNKTEGAEIDELLKNPDFLVQVIRGLMKNHDELLKTDVIYQLYIDKIKNDFAFQDLKKEARQRVSGEGHSDLAKS